MIYLIGGSPRSGKTTLASQLSKKLGVTFTSTDDFESELSKTISFSDHPNLFPKTAIRKRTNQSNDQMYAEFSTEEIVNAYLTQAKALQETITNYMHTASKTDREVIIEGYHVTPEFVTQLSSVYNLKSIFLGRSDKANTTDSIRRSTDANDWVLSKTKHEETFARIAQMVVLFSAEIKKQALSHNLEYQDVDGDFQKQIEKSVDLLVRRRMPRGSAPRMNATHNVASPEVRSSGGASQDLLR